METISILEFRRDAENIIRKVRQGSRFILTYRGKPVMRLEPIIDQDVDPEDPFYTLNQIAAGSGASLTNDEIDEIIYKE